VKFLVLVTALFVFSFQHAMALSCTYSPFEDIFNSHRKPDDTYILVLGQLVNKRAVAPANFGENYTADFIGHMATQSGFDKKIKLTVDVKVICKTGWCGQVALETKILTFLDKTPDGHSFTVGPCRDAWGSGADEGLQQKALRWWALAGE